MCYELGKPLKDVSFERDCPLPNKEDVEGFTRYITKDKTLAACGNCQYWERWGYNKPLKTELGICTNADLDQLSIKACNTKACDEFKEV
jgi:hypothetical protein